MPTFGVRGKFGVYEEQYIETVPRIPLPTGISTSGLGLEAKDRESLAYAFFTLFTLYCRRPRFVSHQVSAPSLPRLYRAAPPQLKTRAKVTTVRRKQPQTTSQALPRYYPVLLQLRYRASIRPLPLASCGSQSA
jgi:hypothetical protein